MKYDFNCKIATQRIKELKVLRAQFKDGIENKKIAEANNLKNKLENLINEAEKIFDPDQVAFRDEIAKEKGYSYIHKFNRNGLAVAETRGSDSDVLINRAGEEVIPMPEEWEYQYIVFSEGIGAVNRHDLNDNFDGYYINEKGERLFPNREFGEIFPFKFGTALVSDENNERTQIDRNGNALPHDILYSGRLNFDSVKGYVDLFVEGGGDEFGNYLFYISPEGKRVPSDPEEYFSAIHNLNFGTAFVHKKNKEGEEKGFYIDQTGQKLTGGLLDEEILSGTYFSNDRAYIMNGREKICLINRQGNLLKTIPGNNFDHLNFSGDMVNIWKLTPDRKESVYDMEGNPIFENFDIIFPFQEGFSIGYKGGEVFILNKNGEMTKIEQIAEPTSVHYEDGVFRLHFPEPEDTEPIFIDKKGNRVFERLNE